ncbi:hypothetical protein ONZ45_g17772 [Pleurotus djamor]|nr:hypothetical protein ONZ45_g17772 [Pleurotus djamor]
MARGKKASNHNQTQSTTLRDFFSPGSKKEAVDATRRSPETSRPRSRIPKNTEVIVIDSSDDECIKATSPRPRKKRRLSPESSDDEVEIVSFSRVIKESSGTTKAPSRTLSEGGTSSVSSKILLRTRSSPAPSTSTRPSLFGQPNHLLGGSPAKSLSFGPPSSLLMDCIPAPLPLQSDVSCDIDLSNLPEDEWGLGDDEMVGNLSLDDDNEETVYDDSGMLSEETLVSEVEKAGSSIKPLSALPRPFGPQRLRSCDGKTASNAFSVIMSSNKDKEAWNEATRAEDPHFRASKENGGRRKAPFYKVMNGMPIAVDAFRYGSIPGVTAYFLTHAHSDHYTNLSSTWKSGPIYCSEGTANLIIHMLSVDRKWVHPLPMDKPTVIPNTGGVTVTLIEANHCPGSCLFFFEGQQTVHAGDSEYKSPYIGSDRTFRYLHCGDFRACPQHVLHPAVKGKRIDQVYLDTTYLDPKPLVISACAELAKKMANGSSCQGNNGRAVTAWLKVPDSIKGKQAADTLFVVG